jgi:ParB-like chromosome segregation protein Spo0J
MAVDFKSEFTRSSEYNFFPQDIKFKPELNGRHEAPNIEDLISDIVKQGQLQPVFIRNDGGKAVLVGGFSRYRAIAEINKRKLTEHPLKVRCVYFKGSEQQGMLANISENRFRNSTTPIDDAYNIARLERYGMTMEQIADHYKPMDDFGIRLEEKKAVKWVKDRLTLIQLSEASAAAVKNGTVKPSAAKILAELSEAQQELALKQAKKNGTTITAASLKAPKAPKAPKAKQTTIADAIDPQESKADPETLYNVIASIAEGGELPFEWEFDVDARKFCKELLKFVSE